MTPTSTWTTILGVGLLTACGTQIGTEDALECLLVSSETLADLDAVPDGFERSPRETVDALLGDFAGFQLGEEEDEVLETTASLGVADTGGDVLLERYEPSTDPELLAEHCPPRLVADLAFTLEAEGLPTWTASVATTFYEDRALVETEGEDGFDGEVPQPTLFDPADYDEVVLSIRLSAGPSTWSPTVRWEAWNLADVAPDGDVAKETEKLLWAELESADSDTGA